MIDTSQQTAQQSEKRSFTVVHKDGQTPLVARIPTHLAVKTAVPEIAAYAGFAPEPDVSTRYALLVANGDGGEFTVLRDDQTFAELEEHSVLRIAPQPRPA